MFRDKHKHDPGDSLFLQGTTGFLAAHIQGHYQELHLGLEEIFKAITIIGGVFLQLTHMAST